MAAERDRLSQQVAVLAAERALILGSTLWRLLAPVRNGLSLLRGRRPTPPANIPIDAPRPAPISVPLSMPIVAEAVPAAGAGKRVAGAPPRILFLSGEPDTPGNQYRCVRYSVACADAGWEANCLKLSDVDAAQVAAQDVIVIWRAGWTDHVAGLVAAAHDAGTLVVFDVDDLMMRPELARIDIIDGIRTISTTEGATREFFGRVQQLMLQCDLCTTTTEEIAQSMRAFGKAAHVMPNGFDAASHTRARLALRRRRAEPDQGAVIRLGYAGGTITHQRDFGSIAAPLARVLRARPHARLTMFHVPNSDWRLVDVTEFPDFADLSDRIEWRPMVALADLPDELARFDINLAPLELGNPFCEAKSELKYFEAALAEVPTVATPTAPFRRAIIDGETGFLPTDTAAWEACLLRLIDDAALRQRIGRAAYLEAAWTYGPLRRTMLTAGLLEQLRGGAVAARAFELQLRRGPYRARGRSELRDAETLFAQDRLAQAEVTVVVASYNYADLVLEALESVRAQTLPVLDLVIVDDASPDNQVMPLLLEWARTHAPRFNRLLVLRHVHNAGLGATRNTGFDQAESDYVMLLDADNRLRPECCAVLSARLRTGGAAYAYPRLQQFGAAEAIVGAERYAPQRLIGGNYIDAMAMVAKAAWIAAGFYDTPTPMGWEDYGLWCQLAELGLHGEKVDQVLAEYRVHAGSMVNAIVETEANKARMVAHIERRHSWLSLPGRDPVIRR